MKKGYPTDRDNLQSLHFVGFTENQHRILSEWIESELQDLKGEDGTYEGEDNTYFDEIEDIQEKLMASQALPSYIQGYVGDTDKKQDIIQFKAAE